MKKTIDGKALVYCEGSFNTPNGKTTHGLVRFTERYDIIGIIDSTYSGQDAGQVLDGKPNGIPIFSSLETAIKELSKSNQLPKTFIVGLAPDGGRLPTKAKEVIRLLWKWDGM